MADGLLTIDLKAIAANWRALDRLTKSTVETSAVVKANAYGLGIEPVAKVLVEAGAKTFFVALAQEGVRLRTALGPDLEIFVFSGYMEGDADACRSARLIPLLNSPEQIRRFRRDLSGHPCGLQFDTGMNRLGIEPAELPGLMLDYAALNPKLIVSHLACADDPKHMQNATQLAAFVTMTAAVSVRKSLAATGGILLGDSYHFDLTRPGVGLYGGLPFEQAQPVVSLNAPVIQVRDVLPSETVGYGATWHAKKLSRIATLSVGYADGILRALSGAQVFAGAKPCPVVGRVSMDLITVDVTHLDEVPDVLDLLGPEQTIDDLAEKAGTIGYEVLTSLGQRYERRYRSA